MPIVNLCAHWNSCGTFRTQIAPMASRVSTEFMSVWSLVSVWSHSLFYHAQALNKILQQCGELITFRNNLRMKISNNL